jgi:DNA-binding response OmpR family regulator
MARILCVDDEPHVVNLRCQVLSEQGHRATPAWTVADAIDCLRRARYDVVITGWRLCDGSGKAIVSAAKALVPAPMVVVSGYAGDGVGSCDQAADVYFNKVIEPDELQAIIRHVL